MEGGVSIGTQNGAGLWGQLCAVVCLLHECHGVVGPPLLGIMGGVEDRVCRPSPLFPALPSPVILASVRIGVKLLVHMLPQTLAAGLSELFLVPEGGTRD